MGLSASKLSKIVSIGAVKRLRGPPLAPKGYIPVAVGVDDKTKRFMVPTTAFCDAGFREFLCRSAEEYGFGQEGILRIPFECKAFEEYLMTKGLSRRYLGLETNYTSLFGNRVSKLFLI